MWEAFQDGEKLGTGENLAPWHPIKPGGVLILGQEQVSEWQYVPGFEKIKSKLPKQTAAVRISLSNTWPCLYTVSERLKQINKYLMQSHIGVFSFI